MTLLGWSLLEFEQGLRQAGIWEEALGALRWGVAYLLKCHPRPGVLYTQVGHLTPTP